MHKKENSVIFEIFELSPTNASVLGTRGRLVREFPATAIAVPMKIFGEKKFQNVLARTLVKMSYQTVEGTKPKVDKAHQSHDEDRDTNHPRIVTELLAGFLRAAGQPVDVEGIRKNTREEVMWDRSKLPWRRSPLWLLIRVSLQLTMQRAVGSDAYKPFMAFLMAQVLDRTKGMNAPGESTHTMVMKVVGRLQKLKEPRSGDWLMTIGRIVSTSSESISQRWTEIQQKHEPLDLAELATLDMQSDRNMSLAALDEFVLSISQRGRNPPTSFQPTTSISLLNADKLPKLQSFAFADDIQADLPFHLYMVELWVASHLTTWTDTHIKDQTSCQELCLLMQSYHEKAQASYKAKPESISRMLLVVLELWVAIDKIAVHATPLLRSYNPEIPLQIYEALLLGLSADMTRLSRAEEYVKERSEFAKKAGRPSIFCSYGEQGSFAVHYVKRSSFHQDLLQRITEDATKFRDAKKAEFEKLKVDYTRLMRLFDQSSCDDDEQVENGTAIHSHRYYMCKHCIYSRQAQSLEIDIHEWPLSSDTLEAQNTVFELAIPDIFGAWRDVTHFLIRDVLECQWSFRQHLDAGYSLEKYSELKHYYQGPNRRVNLRSEAKPHGVTHRKVKSIGHITVDDVCLNNGLRLQYHDDREGTFISGLVPTTKISDQCTFPLPEQSKNLKMFLQRNHANSATPNQAIASQSSCPEHMKLGKYKALVTLLSGYKIQWMNVLTQLAMPVIDFNKEETAIFLLQLSLQVGPGDKGQAHIRLTDGRFGREIARLLLEHVKRIKENWKSHTSLWCFTFLATRCLSMVPSELEPLFLNLISECRDVSNRWLLIVQERLKDTTDSNQRKELQRTILEIALVCLDSFNVEGHCLDKLLADPRISSVLVEVSTIVFNKTNLLTGERSMLNLMYERWMYTLHRARSTLVDQIPNGFLDLAIKRCWSSFKSRGWRLVPSTCQWLEAMSSPLPVHLNILTGQLLVDGKPLSNLPSDYEQHRDYRRIFGSSVLDVLPSSLPGMMFCSTTVFDGHALHFGMQDANLLLRLEKDGSSFDFVPPKVFEMLPHSFVHDYVHWYCHDTAAVEFRSKESIWVPSRDSWYLKKDGSIWKLERNGNFIINPQSKTGTCIARILHPLEASLNIRIMLRDEQELFIELPRLRLDFSLRQGQSSLDSKQFRGMQIDQDQSIGTLIGFTSRLVLRDLGQNRKILIPEGDVKYTKSHGTLSHVIASVTHGTTRSVQIYSIDNLLCRLKGNGRAESNLYLAYLHAITSYCHPDPFTCRTGTEQALEILQSASVRSIGCLDQAALNTLKLIADLSPKRSYYPRHLKTMQTVQWSTSLSFVAQDGRFYKIANGIIKHLASFHFLHPTSVDATQLTLDGSEINLVERDILRNYRQCVSGFGAEDFTHDHDGKYSSRDRSQQECRSVRVTDVASRVYDKSILLPHDVSPDLVGHLYKSLAEKRVPTTQPSALRSYDMEYDSLWLEPPEDILPSRWYHIHSAFRSDSWLDKYQAMMWLATVSYGVKQDDQITQALLMLAISPAVSTSPLPKVPFCHLWKGYELSKTLIHSTITNARREFNDCPERHLAAHQNETWRDAKYRRNREFDANSSKAVLLFGDYISEQWPCSQPTKPHATAITTYIDVSQAMQSVNPVWKTWYNNLKFKDYLTSLVNRMREVPVKSRTVQPLPSPSMMRQTDHAQGFLSISDLFSNPAPFIQETGLPLSYLTKHVTVGETSSMKVDKVVDFLSSKATLKYEHDYLGELRDSLSTLQSHQVGCLDDGYEPQRVEILQQHLRVSERHLQATFNAIAHALNPGESTGSTAAQLILQIATNAHARPRFCQVFILQQLRYHSWKHVSQEWQTTLIAYGLAITAVQKARRLVQLKNPVDLLRELENPGHQGWQPKDYPEWLLIECESEIMIRGVQHQIAQQMINPPSNENAVMQLNMGEGKSSVIIPVVATSLSNGTQLVRVIAAKPQAKQMYQMLVEKLSGLLDRPVYQMPFSRAVGIDASPVNAIRQLAARCIEERGIMLVQPEHLLSFQLMGLEYQIDKDQGLAARLLELQEFFENSSRDLVDESDENFSVKFELVYTIGQQQPIEHSPDRWIIIQHVLALVAKFSLQEKSRRHQSLDIDDRHPERFPKIRILRADAMESIVRQVAGSICSTGMTGFPISRQTEGIRRAVEHYISEREISADDIQAVESSKFWDATTISHILLLRGLFAGGILAFTLGQKRWRVNYGPDENRERRTRLVVPYRAKDNPTPRSEFSHPDVVIVLTCLHYYYSGLKNEDLFSIFNQLTESDNAEFDYQSWVETAPTLPLPLKQLSGVNLRDRTQCESDVFPHIRYSKGAIDYFLSKAVFAKESKEFPHKLSASGWDLGKTKTNPTTGFSGTNDSRYVLPLSMKQLDLPEQKHTNALVLEYLLRPENGVAVQGNADRVTLDSDSLIQMVSQMTPNTRVILDVGAQVIDMSNLEFSKKWLGQNNDGHTQAVVFFDDHDELQILDLAGNVQDLQTSPYSSHLDQCLVFLDEAHTRGTDLKLPVDYQAAVTLGANLTKDRLVQGKSACPHQEIF